MLRGIHHHLLSMLVDAHILIIIRLKQFFDHILKDTKNRLGSRVNLPDSPPHQKFTTPLPIFYLADIFSLTLKETVGISTKM